MSKLSERRDKFQLIALTIGLIAVLPGGIVGMLRLTFNGWITFAIALVGAGIVLFFFNRAAHRL